MPEAWAEHLESVTEPLPPTDPRATIEPIPYLTVLAHPDADRVGEVVALPELSTSGGRVELSRLSPALVPVTVGVPRPLADKRLSRRAMGVERDADGRLVLIRELHPGEVEVDGEPLGGRLVLEASRLERGIVLLLARRVVLLLHLNQPVAHRPPRFGLVGESSAMVAVREAIQRHASGAWSVLVRGESGTGKELVARALHGAGTRARDPFVAVNAAAIPATLAAAELFGVRAGAYSDAKTDRQGYFRRADGGVLFLDEVGAIPPEVQTPLLRVLENGEVQPVGGGAGRRVDVRVLAATDADLEREVEEGRFQSSLFFRLASSEILIPPLRERRDDLGRLLVSFLRKELGVLGFAERLAPTDRPWLGAELVARLARHAWPGNIRELRNLARQLVAECADRSTAVLPASFEQRWQTVAVGSTSGREEAPRPRRRGYRNPATVEGDELLDSLRRHRHNLKATAADLGVSRTSLYKLIEEHPEVRTAAELGPVEIRRALDEAEGDIGRASRQLEVSERALKQRLSQLDDTD